MLTVGTVRGLIESEQCEFINTHEEAGECALCGRPMSYIDIAYSAHPDEMPIDEATGRYVGLVAKSPKLGWVSSGGLLSGLERCHKHIMRAD
ncbi:MAG: hypothetical protein RMK18_11455 [Armatimonadota bacterium]|nr:hypothetical protein [Armatimonadota bacterium]MCX7777527.1 hypothetical protein [Armatimonadota bacterium]MDW8026465.1 hypothetical protein [Armatimonadota bacterium]